MAIISFHNGIPYLFTPQATPLSSNLSFFLLVLFSFFICYCGGGGICSYLSEVLLVTNESSLLMFWTMKNV